MKIGKALSLIFLVAGTAFAEPSINARVSANQMSMDASITLSIELTGISNINDAPDLNLPDFQVQRAGQTQSYQWVNGQSSSLMTFNYILTPTKSGALTIPAITLKQDDKTYNTQPITVTVAGSGSSGQRVQSNDDAPGGSINVPAEGLKPVFMTAVVDKTKVYVGQQVLLTVQFLRRPNVNLASQPRYREPDLTGFVVEQLKQQEFTTNLNGSPYVVTELRYGLFPTSDGDFAIGNAAIDVAIRAPMDPFDPNSIFQNFFNQGQVAKLTTRAIPIQVRALPKGKPDGFSGSVGRFKVSAKADTANAEVGKPLNLLVKVEGIGNIKAIREPSLSDMKSFRRYETIATSKVNNEGKFVYGSKEFKILLIPQVSGTLSIPPVSFSYFNPEEHQYMTDMTQAVILQVKAGSLTTANQDRPMPASVDQADEGIHVVEKDIRFIKADKVVTVKSPLSKSGIFWALMMAPPLFALGAALVAFQTKRRTQRVGFYRSKEAYKTAKKDLKQAKKLIGLEDSSKFYGALYSALVGYLANKLGLSASGALWNEIEMKLIAEKVGDELSSKVRAIWDETDMARFGITHFSLEEKQASLEKTEKTLSELDKIL